MTNKKIRKLLKEVKQDLKNDKLSLTESKIKSYISEALIDSNLTELWSHYHTFWKNHEVTWVIALAESHITFHTWPEKDYISLDIFVCNLNTNNSQKAKKIYQKMIDFFMPWKIEEKFIER